MENSLLNKDSRPHQSRTNPYSHRPIRYRCLDKQFRKTHCKKTNDKARGYAKTAGAERGLGGEEVGGNL